MRPFEDSALSPRERARDLVHRMTLEEKAGQLNQKLYGFSCYTRNGNDIDLTDEFRREVDRCHGLGALYGLWRADPWSGRTHETGLSGALAVKAYNLAQKYVIDHSRFGVPALFTTECPHGHQALDGYLLPVNLAVGATFRPRLLKDGMAVCGRQLRQVGAHMALMSMLDVARDPRWGRCEECYGEDPLLCARFAAAAVEGMREAGVMAVAKHFCAQGETTGGVNASAARIGERELRQIHLPPARAAVRAGAEGVMAAYNEIDGVPCHANRRLLRDILRGEFGFEGAVMADGCALDALNSFTGDPAASAALALESGVDISLWDNVYTHLSEAVQRGLVDEQRLDEAAERVLELKFRLGLFEHPCLPETEAEAFDCDRYPQSLNIARESAVLLQNDGMLPLMDGGRLAVIGPGAEDLYRQLGDYTPPTDKGVSLLSGIKAALPNTDILYDPGDDPARAAALAAQCGRAVLCLGGTSSRFGSVRFDKNGAALTADDMDCGEGVDSAALRLPGGQEALARAVRDACARVCTVILAGRAYAMDPLMDLCDALLYCFYPGPWGGRAVGEILSGQVDPSGRLPVSLPRTAEQLPVYYNGKSGARPWGYREKALSSPAFRFGDGMGYGHAAYSGFSVETAPGTIALRFRAENRGDIPCHAVPLVYIRRLKGDTVPRTEELKGFDKRLLLPGEAWDGSITLAAEELMDWGRDMRLTLTPGPVRLILRDGFDTLYEDTVDIKEA